MNNKHCLIIFWIIFGLFFVAGCTLVGIGLGLNTESDEKWNVLIFIGIGLFSCCGIIMAGLAFVSGMRDVLCPCCGDEE